MTTNLRNVSEMELASFQAEIIAELEVFRSNHQSRWKVPCDTWVSSQGGITSTHENMATVWYINMLIDSDPHSS